MYNEAPLVGPFLGGFYFYTQNLQTLSQGCYTSNISVFGQPVHEKRIFLISQNFTPFCPLLGPNRCQPLIFALFNPHSPKTILNKFG